MLFELLLTATLFVTQTLTEAPLNNEAPYAAAGFRPTIPFDLPGEYYPSFEVDSEQQLPNEGISFVVSKQRVDFAGQDVQHVPVLEPQNQYLPPEQIVFINNRFGNNNRGTRGFDHRHNHRRQNGNGHGQTPMETPQNKPPQFQPSIPPLNAPRPRPNTDERFESQKFFPKEPQSEYGVPFYNIQPRNSGQQFQRPSSQHVSNAALEYAPPKNNYFESQQQQPQKPALEYGAPDIFESQKQDELVKQFALDALNAAVQNYNRLQEDYNDKIAVGQYFVVNPDHSIQKVKFTTKKSEDATKQYDFTAELKYTKVGEINYPLYKYTDEGQLVRIVKK